MTDSNVAQIIAAAEAVILAGISVLAGWIRRPKAGPVRVELETPVEVVPTEGNSPGAELDTEPIGAHAALTGRPTGGNSPGGLPPEAVPEND